jgi:hypothetical protein
MQALTTICDGFRGDVLVLHTFGCEWVAGAETRAVGVRGRQFIGGLNAYFCVVDLGVPSRQ